MLRASWKPGAATPGSAPVLPPNADAPFVPKAQPGPGSWNEPKRDDLMNMFDSGQTFTPPPSAPPPAATPPSAPGEFTRIFSGTPVPTETPRVASTPYGQMQNAMPAAPTPPAAPARPTMQGGAGEFTRMMSTPVRPPAPAAPAVAAPAKPAAPAKNPMMPLIIGLSILLVLAIVAVVAFWLLR
jgi:hypothetical protein